MESWWLETAEVSSACITTIKIIRNGPRLRSTPTIRSRFRILCSAQSKPSSLLHVLIWINVGSSDGTLQIVDMRANSYTKSQLKIKAHKVDVNVCDWNKVAAHLIVTGSDDCKVKVWDLRMASEGSQD